MKEFRSDLANIGELFGNYQVLYKIPILQRKFVWQEDDVRELLDDIESSFSRDPQSHYFVGGMVFSKDGGERLNVIDGQQRLATLILLLSSARDYFKSKGDADQVSFFKTKMGTTFQDPNTGDVKDQFFLELQDRDDPTFRLLLQGKEVTKKKISVSEKNLINAKSVTKDFIDKLSNVKKYMAYVLSRVHIVRTVAEDQSTAFQIFETLNDRGASLEPEDLLKNLLLQTMDDTEYSNFAERWQRFVENLMEKGRYVVRIPAFLKHFVMSKGDYIGKNGIFDWFKDKQFTHDQIIELLDELEFCSKNYRLLYEGTFNKYSMAMKQLLFKQGNIVMLGSLRLNPTDIEKISAALESIAFSYIMTGTKTNELEKPFCSIAKKAREAENDPDKVQEIIKELNTLSCDKKDSIRFSIEKLRYTSQSENRKIEYLLRKMASSLDGADYSEYTVEHILPQTRLSNGLSVSDEEYGDLISRIGNLSLVSASDNAALQNKTFSEKQIIYSKQSCRLTSSLAKVIQTGTSNTKFDKAINAFNYTSIPSKWDQKEINKRSSSMISLLEHIFY